MSQTKLIEDNINLVYHIVHRQYPTYWNDEDLIQCGMMGLCSAANTWDGVSSKFSTYACKCITNAIRYELAKRSRRVPQISLDHKITDDSEDTIADLLCYDEVDFIFDIQFDDFFATLKPREREIVKLLSTGLGQRGVSEELGISKQAVNQQVHKLKSKWRKYNGKNQN